MISLAQTLYGPLLSMKPAELTAYSELTGPEKERMLPVFRFRPWLSSNSLDAALTKLEKATTGHLAAAVLDTSWAATSATREASAQFRMLVDDSTGRSFAEFMRPLENILPCLRPQLSQLQYLQSTEAEWLVERGFGIVVNLNDLSRHQDLLDFVSTIEHSNFFVLIDCEWSRDPVLFATMAVNLVRNLLAANDGLNLFLSASSFPESFSDIHGQDYVPIKELELFELVSADVRRTYNNVSLRYSDWATTRKSNSGGGGAPPPRIDVPIGNRISIHRDAESGNKTAGFSELAREAFRFNPWPSPPLCWGHNCLNLTLAGAQGGVYNLQKNTAVRANIHMHNMIARLLGGPIALDEPFTL